MKNHDVIQEDGLYPIRTVAQLTGVNPVTLRAWERRYKLIRPIRTPKGHRLYNQHHIEQIRKVLKLLEQGISIGQVSPLLQQENISLHETRSEAVVDKTVWEQYQQRMLDAVYAFDERKLDAVYNDALSLYPIDLVTSKLTTPLLTLLGDAWEKRESGIAEEHFFSVYLRNKIGSRVQHTNLRSNGPCLLVACLPGEQHEIGLLLFTLSAINNGYRCINLGANTPLEQLSMVVQHQKVDAIVLSASTRLIDATMKKQLNELSRNSMVPVLMGGTISDSYQKDIESAGVIPLGSGIHSALEILAGQL